jgi:type IV pilus assembly protein PilP
MPESEILSPLQRFEITQLKLTGLVLDLRTPRAMVQDNSGMGYIITPGTPIGRRHGVVKSIEPGRVIVEEAVLDYYGRQQLHQVVMEMAKDDRRDDGSGEKR